MKKPRDPKAEAFRALDALTKFWILDEDHIPKMVPAKEWAEWNEKGDFEARRRVGSTETATMWVSTVFLHGSDHNFRGTGPAILFETMVFSKEKFPREFKGKIYWHREDFEQLRYSTWDDAETGHKAMVRRIEKLEADALAGIGKIKEPKK